MMFGLAELAIIAQWQRQCAALNQLPPTRALALAFACREKKGYSGVTTYASTDYAPLDCEVDSLGSGEDDIDREGR